MIDPQWRRLAGLWLVGGLIVAAAVVLSCGCERRGPGAVTASPTPRSPGGVPGNAQAAPDSPKDFELQTPAGMTLLSRKEKTATYVGQTDGVRRSPPLLVVTRSSTKFGTDRTLWRRATEQFIRDMKEIDNVRRFNTKPSKVHDLEGFESLTDGLYQSLAVRVLCVKLFLPQGSYTFLAIMPASEAEALEPGIRAAIATFRQVDSNPPSTSP